MHVYPTFYPFQHTRSELSSSMSCTSRPSLRCAGGSSYLFFIISYSLFLISYFCFIKGVRRDLLRDHLCHDGHRQHCLQPHRGHLPHSRCTRKQSRRQLTNANANGRNYQDISNANTFSRPLSLEWDRIVFLNGVSDHVDGPVLPETHPQRPDQRIKVIKTPPSCF